MSTSERFSAFHAEPLFSELPKPAQTPVTVVAPMMAMPPTLTPKQILVHHSADQWEEFIYEWVSVLKEAEYVEVVGMGGANDGGADIAAFLTKDKTDGPWHCFQCKHYGKAIGAATAYPEILKIHSAARCRWPRRRTQARPGKRPGPAHRFGVRVLEPCQRLSGGSGADIDALPAAHPEADWEQLRTVEKGQRSPLAALAKQAAPA